MRKGSFVWGVLLSFTQIKIKNRMKFFMMNYKRGAEITASSFTILEGDGD